MTNKEVLKVFLNRGYASTPCRKKTNENGSYYVTTLTTYEVTKGNSLLYNYDTIIAEIHKNILYINISYYSKTTSIIQHQLYELTKQYDYIIMFYFGRVSDKDINKVIEKILLNEIKDLQNQLYTTTKNSDKVDIYCKLARLFIGLNKTDKVLQIMHYAIELDKIDKNIQAFASIYDNALTLKKR